ncbi:MAG: superoxide dismutase [Acaryochloridaceae cyanobacterium SU_2_1]|nr:superoxide dismutase [Acaryochloridaceae cyanobacterium SU_2_1]
MRFKLPRILFCLWVMVSVLTVQGAQLPDAWFGMAGDGNAIAAPLLAAANSKFTVPPLPYAYDALSPYIDAQTMTIHHDKHHGAYVTNLNKAIGQYPNLAGRPIEDLLANLENLPEEIRSSVRNNGGGHANHSLFWSSMAPQAGGQPQGELAQAIDSSFGSFDQFKLNFNKAGMARFGSGWVWLILDQKGNLAITSTTNQDSPILEGQIPLLGNDVWEHAYYLTYQNRRGDYLNAWWNLVNWAEINQRYLAASQS